VDKITNDKSGYRPSQKYEFVPLKGDVWLWFWLLIIKAK
jgi:hypothetical protein